MAVDFDGVIHSYTSPWIGPEVIPDPPVPGVMEWLAEMAEHFQVVVHTTRAKTPEGAAAVMWWIFDRSGLTLPVTAMKPTALIYVDDRAWRFEGRFPTKEEIHQARPWNKAK